MAAEAPARPLVTLKLALDQQGAVDDRSADAKRFTSEASLDAVHRLRRDSQAVLVGVDTVLRDDPSLTVRRVPLEKGQKQPLRIVLDRRLRITENEQCKLLRDGNPTTVLFVDDNDSDVMIKAAEMLMGVLGKPVLAVDVPTKTPKEGCPLPTVMQMLSKHGVKHLMIEGGPSVARSFLAQNLVDRAIIIKAPVTFQDPVPSGIDSSTLESAGLQLLGTTDWGGDTVECWATQGTEWPNGGVGSWP